MQDDEAREIIRVGRLPGVTWQVHDEQVRP